MNRPRLLLGGLAAGILLVATGVGLGHGVLGAEYVRAFASHRAHPVNVVTVLENTSLRLLYGFLVVFLYAAIRPRFGAGPRTAILAALVLWVAAILPRNMLLSEFGIVSGGQLGLSLAYGAAELILAALVGGAIYRERSQAAVAGASAKGVSA
ncbi:MAG TPA: hypothetical protein VFU59_03640 [Candidatus Eisenbacteria bacterium]|nr:hypothetical protein [Candidatus Eisenbacteria bacterium]